MTFKQDNVAYYNLKFNPKSPEEAIDALRKIQEAPHEAWKPDVAGIALNYFNVIINNMTYCNWYRYLNGEVYNKMSLLAGNSSKDFVDSQGYINSFYVAIELMINKSELYFTHKEKFDKNISLFEILEGI